MSDEPVEDVVAVDVEKLPSMIKENTVHEDVVPQLLAVATVADEDVTATTPSNNPIDLGELGIIAADDGGVADVIDAFDKAVIVNSEERTGQNSYDELQKIQSVQSHLSAGTLDFAHDYFLFFEDAISSNFSSSLSFLPTVKLSRNLVL
jgi:hypothetical protein